MSPAVADPVWVVVGLVLYWGLPAATLVALAAYSPGRRLARDARR